jgi:hypothetical protein
MDLQLALITAIAAALVWCLRHERRRQVDERFRLYQGEL